MFDFRFSVFHHPLIVKVFLVSRNALFTLGRGGGGGGVAVLVFLASLLVVHSEKTLPVDATGRRAAVRKLSFETPAQLAVAGPNMHSKNRLELMISMLPSGSLVCGVALLARRIFLLATS